jgi:hypothetical protein
MCRDPIGLPFIAGDRKVVPEVHDYESPNLVRLGSIHEFTQQTFNKVGVASDVFTQLTNGIVIGSLVNSP